MNSYPLYKSSGINWLGEIPEHWNTQRLKYHVSINARTLTEDTHESREINYVDIGNVKENVEVIGVSFDSAESHQKFISNHNLNFPLLADTDGKIADAYGVRMTGKNMARRVSFLIGLDGKIAHVTNTPAAETHLTEMKEAVEKLKKS